MLQVEGRTVPAGASLIVDEDMLVIAAEVGLRDIPLISIDGVDPTCNHAIFYCSVLVCLTLFSLSLLARLLVPQQVTQMVTDIFGHDDAGMHAQQSSRFGAARPCITFVCCLSVYIART